jgi:hypothetical protein
MKNSTKTFLTYTMVFIIIVLGIYGFMGKNTSSPGVIKEKTIDPLVEMKAKMWDSYVTTIIPDLGKKVSPSIMVQDVDTKKYKLSDVLSNRNKLIFRFSYRDCEVCIDTVLNQLNQLSKKYSIMDVVVITDSYSPQAFLVKSEHSRYPKFTYSIVDTAFGLSLEDKGSPFLFIMDKNYSANKIFIPVKENPQQIKRYLIDMLIYLKEANAV